MKKKLLRKLACLVTAASMVLPGVGVMANTQGQEVWSGEWKGIAFGQSTDLNFASTILPEKVGSNYARETKINFLQESNDSVGGTAASTTDSVVTIGSNTTTSSIIELDAVVIESRGGKIANSHDGLAFYYTKVPTSKNFKLEADVHISQLGPENSTTPNNQEGAGLMVRDIISTPRKEPMEFGYEELPAASNFAATALMASARTKVAPIKVQVLHRNGIVEPFGNVGAVLTRGADVFNLGTNLGNRFITSAAETAHNPDYFIEKDFFKLGLERTDTGFVMTYSDLAGNVVEQRSISGADRVAVIDKDYMYVGFFAARNAKMIVKNIQLTTSEAQTVEEGFKFAEQATSFTMASPTTSSTEDYVVRAISNYDGKVTLEKDGVVIASEMDVLAGEFFEYPTKLTSSSTNFNVSFAPAELNTVVQAVTRNFTVTLDKQYEGRDLYVSLDGVNTGAGTKEEPLDLSTALNYISPGKTIYVMGGEYSALNIPIVNSGNKDARKVIEAYEGENVVLKGAVIGANYWHFKNINVANAPGTGMRITGSGNIVESCTFYGNGDTGLQISAASTTIRATWPKDNYILNCTSYNNRDASGINADGFAAKLGVGRGNVFEGCIAHNNADDGWDLFNKLEDGPNEPITLINCIAYENGLPYSAPTPAPVGSIGNGFKLGGEGFPVNHIIKNSIAFNNNMDGFTCNFNPGQITVENCTSFNNARSNYIFRSNPYRTPAQQGIFNNNISFRTDNNYNTNDFISGNVNNSFFFLNGNDRVTAADFVSITAPSQYLRDENDNIIWGDFLKLTASSNLNKAGVGGTYIGALKGDTVNTTPSVPSTPSTGSGTSSGGGAPSANTTQTQVVSISNAEAQNLIAAAENKKEIVITANKANAVVELASLLFTQDAGKIKQVVINNTLGAVTLPLDAVSIAKDEKVYVEVKKSSAASNTYVLTISSGTDSNNLTAVSTLKKPLTLSVAYQKETAKNENHLTMFRVLEDGTLKNVGGFYKDGKYTTRLSETGEFVIKENKVSFADVKETDKHYEAVSFLASKGYVKGINETTFAPEKSMTRAEFTQLVAGILDVKNTKSSAFKDVAGGAWYNQSINACYEAGIIQGVGNGNFAPQASIKREDMAVLLYRTALYLGVDEQVALNGNTISFADQPNIADYSKQSIMALANLNVIDADGTFRPKEIVTREEMAIALEKIVKLIK